MEHANKIKETIDAYMSSNDLNEDELTVFLQMDYDDEHNDFTIDYTLTSHEEEIDMTIDTGFYYDTLPETWENFIDQVGELNHTYQEARILHPHPEEYKGGKIGGNPVMSIPDAESDLKKKPDSVFVPRKYI